MSTAEKAKEYYWKHRDEILTKKRVFYLTRRAQLMCRYGVTLEQYEEMLHKQNGVCAICQNPATGYFKHLVIDHDHATRKFRGLLCSKCNRAIGLLRESADMLEQAAKYLRKVEN
jgi:hypothetical protein